MAENQEATPLHQDSLLQRVFNDLYRARLSRGSMIWLLAHPLTPLDRGHTEKLRKRDKLLMGAEGG